MMIDEKIENLEQIPCEICDYGTYKGVKGRFSLLAQKLISFKFVCLLITCLLLVFGYVDNFSFVSVLLAVLFGRESQKIIEKVKGVKNEMYMGSMSDDECISQNKRIQHAVSDGKAILKQRAAEILERRGSK